MALPNSVGKKDAATGAGSGGSTLVELLCRSSNLDELEEIHNRVVSPLKLIPLSRGAHANGVYNFRGQSGFGLFNCRFGRRIDLELGPEEGSSRLAFVTTAAGSGQFMVRGEEIPVSRNAGLVVGSDVTKRLRYAEDTENQVLILDWRKVDQYCAKLLGRDVEGPVRFETSAPLDTPEGRSWLRVLDFAAAELDDPHSLVRTSRVAYQQLEQMVVTAFLLGRRHSHSDALLRPQGAAAPYYVKRAEAYIEARYAEALSLAEIASHAGVSARSLQSGFQTYRAMTPMAFLRMVRLQKARAVLLAGEPVLSTVTDIALACGFNHMGEFASAYRRAFGETPSHTLLMQGRRRR